MGCIESGNIQARDVAEIVLKEREASGKPVPPQENKIFSNECNLPLAKIKTQDFIKSIKTEAVNDQLSKAQLTRAFFDLGIADDIASPDSPLFKVIRRCKTQKLYDANKLALIAILIGNSNSGDKAEWLFKLYDRDASGMLSADELKNMLGGLAEMSFDALPSAAVGEGPEKLTQDEADEYIGTLKGNLDDFIKTTLEEILTEEGISAVDFKQKLGGKSNSLAKLTSSTGVRVLCNPN